METLVFLILPFPPPSHPLLLSATMCLRVTRFVTIHGVALCIVLVATLRMMLVASGRMVLVATLRMMLVASGRMVLVATLRMMLVASGRIVLVATLCMMLVTGSCIGVILFHMASLGDEVLEDTPVMVLSWLVLLLTVQVPMLATLRTGVVPPTAFRAPRRPCDRHWGLDFSRLPCDVTLQHLRLWYPPQKLTSLWHCRGASGRCFRNDYAL